MRAAMGSTSSITTLAGPCGVRRGWLNEQYVPQVKDLRPAALCPGLP
jgi:hypothetical protein